MLVTPSPCSSVTCPTKTCSAHSHRIDARPHPPTSVHLLVPSSPLHSHPSPLRFFLSHSRSYKEISAIFKRQPAGYGAWGAAETPGWATWVCLSFLCSICLYLSKDPSSHLVPNWEPFAINWFCCSSSAKDTLVLRAHYIASLLWQLLSKADVLALFCREKQLLLLFLSHCAFLVFVMCWATKWGSEIMLHFTRW